MKNQNNGARTSNLKMELMYESEKQVVMHHFAAEISIYKVTALRCLYKVKNHKKSGIVIKNYPTIIRKVPVFMEIMLF